MLDVGGQIADVGEPTVGWGPLSDVEELTVDEGQTYNLGRTNH